MPKKSNTEITDTPSEIQAIAEAEAELAMDVPEQPEPEEPAADKPTLSEDEIPQEEDRGGPTTAAPKEQLPLAIALPQQTRRVREQVLPAWYAHRYNPASPAANDPAVADHIMTMNAALTTAEQAMMTQDVGLMLFAYRALERFQV